MRRPPLQPARDGLRIFPALLVLLSPAFCWNGDPTPHDDRHLIILRPGALQTLDGGASPKEADNGAVFGGKAVPVAQPVRASIPVKFQGNYTLWVRVGQEGEARTPLRVDLVREEKKLADAVINDGEGNVERGGAAGFKAYQEVALKTTPDGKVEEGALGIAADGAKDGDAEIGEEEFLGALGQEKKTWVNMLRVDSPSGKRPFYWWKVATVPLEPGEHLLGIHPERPARDGAAPLIDAAFLTTYEKLVYPYAGDISAPRASYIRFRLTKVPESGVTLSAGMRVHYDPWSTGRAALTPSGMSAKGAAPHRAPGFTRWYRLQDIEKAPGMGGGLCHLLLSVQSEGPREGATQFAVWPHQDQVLREIGWDEPEGLRISMATDFENHLHSLRTFRDHARENYERALRATGGRVFPLTRGPLYLGNAWGYATDSPYEYMVKTLRLLGFNCASAPHDAVRSRRNYGWTLHAGQYWPPSFMPFDEEPAKKKYLDHYQDKFEKQRELYEGVSIYQIADEPGEIARAEMTSPLWRYQESKTGGKWADPAGGSDLNSRTDLHDCVLEGKVEKHGQNFTFRAALDDAENPKKYAYWTIGKVAWTPSLNLAVGTVGYGTGGQGTMARAGANVAASPTPFKIVFEGGRAALYLNGQLIHQHEGLPEKGGFGFSGPAKAIAELRFRPIGKDEHITAQSAKKLSRDLENEGPGEAGFDVGELEIEEEEAKPEWLEPLPLKEMVEKHWVVSGGMPEAHAAFRRWAADQGLKPELFGKKSWDEVRMLTVPSLAKTGHEKRVFYWSRRYSGYLTPRMFKLAADGIRNGAPNKDMLGFVALSGHALYFPSQQPLDMFRLAGEGYPMMPGVSDWMSSHGWRWDSHQAVAFSVAPYNAGARRYGAEPVSYPMMHCVWPSVFRAYTMLANNVKYISYYNYGPVYMVTEGFWSDSEGCYHTGHLTNNRAAQVDDILAPGRMRPGRVAMLYAMSTEYWNAQSSFADKRAAFLGLSHEYFKPELVTEDQVNEGALEHYDALYVLDPWVAGAVQDRIAEWVRGGGLLWACADALTRDEYDEPRDLLAGLAEMKRNYGKSGQQWLTMSPEGPDSIFRAHGVGAAGVPENIQCEGAAVRGRYDEARPAWLEKPVGQGKVVYLGHRCGHAYTWKAIRIGGHPVLWADTGRASLTRPLHEAGTERELYLSEPLVVASPISTDKGTVVVLYNMQPNPLQDVEVVLTEPRKPYSVKTFDGSTLVPLDHEFRDGRVFMKLERLHGGQMIVVRREVPPVDDRLEGMRARTEQQLASKDWQDNSAGAWFAGFHPEWDLAGKVGPLLEHERWEVRRVAGEALGKIGNPQSAEKLYAAAKRETDAHALGDMLVSLAQLGHPQAATLCREQIAHANWFVRQQSLRAAATLLEQEPEKTGATALEIAEQGLKENDLRVRAEAIRLISRAGPGQILQATLDAYSGKRDSREQPHWLDALCASEDALREYSRQGRPGGEALFLTIAARRPSPEFALALTELAEKGPFRNANAFFWAALAQRDPALTRKLFEKRKQLPKPLQALMPKLLEITFGARLGNVMPDWEQWLAKNGNEG